MKDMIIRIGDYDLISKRPSEIKNCKKGKYVNLVFQNEMECNGFFCELNGDDIILQVSTEEIVFSVSKLAYYFEEVKLINN
jgi:hypothetical protein